MNHQATIQAALAGILAIGIGATALGAATGPVTPKANQEKCYGIAKASQNDYLDGGPALASLARIRADYPLSLHGVGMSLGSADPLDLSHVEKLRKLIARIEPALVSEHLCWSGIAGRHLNDLLPLPYTDEALALACARVAELQER